MYEAFFGLKEKPFSLTPNPRYLFYTERHRAALEHLLYGLDEKEGFMLLTGVVGTGKTTLCRDLLSQLDTTRYRTALVFNPFLNGIEMLRALLSEFGAPYTPDMSRKELLDNLNRYLLAQLVEGHTCVAIFDEAQHLSTEFLEQIRVLSNLETEEEKLLQIILVGQPELRQRIEEPALAQLDQRVSIRCTLSKLGPEETERYVYHRLNVAGAQGRLTFKPRAIKLIHEESQGIPRLINLIADRALLAAYVSQQTTITPKHVQQGLISLRDQEPGLDGAPSRLSRPRVGSGGALVLVAVVLILALLGAAAYAYGLLP